MTAADLIVPLAKALLFTEIAEIAAALILGLRKLDILFVFLVNVLTNPLLNITLDLYCFGSHSMPPRYLILALEIAAVAAEGLIYSKGLSYKKLNPFLLSILLNAISYFGGVLLF